MGAALFARRHHRDSRAWALLGGTALIGFLLAIRGAGKTDVACGFVLMASLLGFLGQEIWQAARGWVRNPRNFRWVAMAVAGGLSLLYPPLLGAMLTLGLMGLGLWTILRGFRR